MQSFPLKPIIRQKGERDKRGEELEVELPAVQDDTELQPDESEGGGEVGGSGGRFYELLGEAPVREGFDNGTSGQVEGEKSIYTKVMIQGYN